MSVRKWTSDKVAELLKSCEGYISAERLLEVAIAYIESEDTSKLDALETKLTEMVETERLHQDKVFVRVERRGCGDNPAYVYEIFKRDLEYLQETNAEVFYFSCGNHDHGPYSLEDILVELIEDDVDIREIIRTEGHDENAEEVHERVEGDEYNAWLVKKGYPVGK